MKNPRAKNSAPLITLVTEEGRPLHHGLIKTLRLMVTQLGFRQIILQSLRIDEVLSSLSVLTVVTPAVYLDVNGLNQQTLAKKFHYI